MAAAGAFVHPRFGLTQQTPAPCDFRLQEALSADMSLLASRRSQTLKAASSPPEYKTCGCTSSKAAVQHESEWAFQDEMTVMLPLAMSMTCSMPAVLLRTRRLLVPAAKLPQATLMHTPAPSQATLATCVGVGAWAPSAPTIPVSTLKRRARSSEHAVASRLAPSQRCSADHAQSSIPTSPTVASLTSAATSSGSPFSSAPP
eukprot:scaffold122855_cov31-Tisochrysis_lutea.AAC.1